MVIMCRNWLCEGIIIRSLMPFVLGTLWRDCDEARVRMHVQQIIYKIKQSGDILHSE